MSSLNELDGTHPPSDGKVVDHHAAKVIDKLPEVPARPRRPKSTMMQPLKRSDMQPSYAQDLRTGGATHGIHGSILQGLGTVVGFFGPFPCCPCRNPLRNVQEGSVGLVSRFGRIYKSVDPGLVHVNVCTEDLRIVDVKIQTSPIGRQTVTTRDSVTVEIDSDIYFQIYDPYRAAFGITDLDQALIERAQTTLRQVVGARAAKSVASVTEREAIASEIAEIVGDVADKWGVAIEGILIKNITVIGQSAGHKGQRDKSDF